MSITPLSSVSAGTEVAFDRPAAAVRAARPASSGAFNAAALRNAPEAEQRKSVAAQFEAILVRQLLGKTMTSMLGGAEGGVAGSVYGDMLADTIAQQLSSGAGLGLGRYLEQQLAPAGNREPHAGDDQPAAEVSRL